MKKRFFLLTFFILIILGFISFRIFIKTLFFTPQFTSLVKNEIQKNLNNSINAEIDLSNLAVTSTGNITISNIKLQKNSLVFLESPEIIVKIHWTKLLKSSKNISNIIKEIVIVKPKFYIVRDTSGIWNFQQLLLKKAPAKPVVLPKFKLKITDASLYFKDDLANLHSIKNDKAVTIRKKQVSYLRVEKIKKAPYSVRSTGRVAVSNGTNIVGSLLQNCEVEVKGNRRYEISRRNSTLKQAQFCQTVDAESRVKQDAYLEIKNITTTLQFKGTNFINIHFNLKDRNFTRNIKISGILTTQGEFEFESYLNQFLICNLNKQITKYGFFFSPDSKLNGNISISRKMSSGRLVTSFNGNTNISAKNVYIHYPKSDYEFELNKIKTDISFSNTNITVHRFAGRINKTGSFLLSAKYVFVSSITSAFSLQPSVITNMKESLKQGQFSLNLNFKNIQPSSIFPILFKENNQNKAFLKIGNFVLFPNKFTGLVRGNILLEGRHRGLPLQNLENLVAKVSLSAKNLTIDKERLDHMTLIFSHRNHIFKLIKLEAHRNGEKLLMAGVSTINSKFKPVKYFATLKLTNINVANLVKKLNLKKRIKTKVPLEFAGYLNGTVSLINTNAQPIAIGDLYLDNFENSLSSINSVRLNFHYAGTNIFIDNFIALTKPQQKFSQEFIATIQKFVGKERYSSLLPYKFKVNGSKDPHYAFNKVKGAKSPRYIFNNVDITQDFAICRGKINTDKQNQNLEIEINSLGITSYRMMKFIGKPEVPSSGFIELAGRIYGPLSKPIFSANARGNNLTISSLPIRKFDGKLEYKDGKFFLNDFSIVSANKNKTNFLNGYFILGDNRFLDIEFDINGLKGEEFFAFLKGAFKIYIENILSELPKQIDGQLHIKGYFKAPVIEGNMKLFSLALLKKPTKQLKFTFLYDKSFHIKNGTIFFDSSPVDFYGSYKDKNLSIDFNSKKFDIADIQIPLRYKFSGIIQLDGKIVGSIDTPIIEVALTSKSISIGDVTFKLPRAVLTYSKDTLAIGKTLFSRGNERYIVSGKYDFALASLDVNLHLDRAQLQTVTKFVTTNKQDFSGHLSGNIHLFEIVDKIAGDFNLRSSNITLGNYYFSDFLFNGKFSQDSIDVLNLTAIGEDAKILAGGKIMLSSNGNSSFNVYASDINLNKLKLDKLSKDAKNKSILIPAKAENEMTLHRQPVDNILAEYNLKGKTDINLQLMGNRNKYNVYGAFIMKDFSVSDVSFEKVNGELQYDGSLLVFKDVSFATNTDKINVFASLLTTSILDKEKFKISKLQISIQTDKFNLANINPLIKNSRTVLDGNIASQFEISGNIDNPNISGSLTIDNAIVNYTDFKNPISNITGKLLFSGDAVIINNLKGKIGQKTVTGQGIVNLEQLLPNSFNFEISAVDVPFGYKDLFDGKVTASLIISGTTTEPYVDGAVLLTDAKYVLPEITPKYNISSPIARIKLGKIRNEGIVLTIGDNFLVRNSKNNLKLYPSGTLYVSGQLIYPVITGVLKSTRGSLRYLNTTFYTAEETLISFFRLGTAGAIPFFHATAKSRTSGTDVFLDISGPMIDIEKAQEYQKYCAQQETGTSYKRVDISSPTILVEGESLPICMKVKFYTENANLSLSTQEIFAKLTRTEAIKDVMAGEEDVNKFLSREAFGLFSAPIGKVFEQGGGLENFQFNLEPNKDILIQLEKNFKNKLSLKYTRIFSQTDKQTFETKYKFRKKSFLSWQVDEKNKSNYRIQHLLDF